MISALFWPRLVQKRNTIEGEETTFLKSRLKMEVKAKHVHIEHEECEQHM